MEFLINYTKKDAIYKFKEGMLSPLCLKGTWFCQVARHCSEVYKKCTTDSTGSLLSSCHSSLANWWRNKLCYRKQRTDSRHRYWKRKSESCKIKTLFMWAERKNRIMMMSHASKGQEENLGAMNCGNLFFYISPITALILMGLQWLLAITDCFERGLVFRYSQVRKNIYPSICFFTFNTISAHYYAM